MGVCASESERDIDHLFFVWCRSRHSCAQAYPVLINLCVCLTEMQYITCRAQKCSEEGRQYPFSGRIDTNSLVVQDQYIFLQVQMCVRFIKCISVCDLD